MFNVHENTKFMSFVGIGLWINYQLQVKHWNPYVLQILFSKHPNMAFFNVYFPINRSVIEFLNIKCK